MIQIDGRVRDRMTVPADVDRDTYIRAAERRPRISDTLRGRRVRDVIVIPGKVVNFVTVGEGTEN